MGARVVTARTGARGFSTPSPREVVLRYLLLVVALFVTVGPFLWQLSTSLKGAGEDVYTSTPSFVPSEPTLDNYARAFEAVPILGFAGNSLVVAGIVVVGNIVGATLAGYALARLRFRGARLVLGAILFTMLLPGEATIVAQYLTIRQLGLADTLLGVALPGAVGMLNVLLMRTAFVAVPKELDEAAIVDGANAWQRLWHVGVPNVLGMLAVVAIFAFIGAWDDFLWPLIVLTTPEKFTLTVGLEYLSGTFTNNPRVVAAGTMIAFVPIVVFFAALQRYFFRGVDEGAIKG
ncbi:carbohydrate ABC transporter permease [Promicromonospora thailandica]|uniref:Multiple sugar transport system permease protein n=1 Tax=Promicromonospora thailandica TaxID=765201 RepID=A0A9X2JUH4_9MICO|nr:carbohydrate ABC transporter permease [Promicromonospora thailandica]MCP2264031.1 multiple sugar transport system permease protein [Promicromonospora thailandica]BFF17630.1 carbohydrate ABC transporter permease [Promicromonospora thailandica]